MKLFKRKTKPETQKVKSFTIGTYEMQTVGEKYEYIIEAESREEAFNKLIQFFYGENKNQPVKQNYYDMARQGSHEFFGINMPDWFARTLSAKGTKEDYDKLEKYAEKHNIKLKEEL